MRRTLIVTTAIASLLTLPAYAQDDAKTGGSEMQAQSGEQQDAPIIALNDWNYDEIYQNGWSLTKLMDADVVGESGEEIGDVENVLLNQDGKILSVIAEIGGFLDIGDTHVAVPFDKVEIGADLDKITVPVNQENVEDYSVFGEWGYFDASEAGTQKVVNDDLLTGPRVWKATELLDDYAVLTGGIGYGYVDDLIFVDGGQLHAVVVDPAADYGPGPYAYPYYGYAYGWYPGAPNYDLRYSKDQVAVIDTFDPEQMQGADNMATGSVDNDQSQDMDQSQEMDKSQDMGSQQPEADESGASQMDDESATTE
jgi:sporulation protein YlmC with PRC-barrel domain